LKTAILELFFCTVLAGHAADLGGKVRGEDGGGKAVEILEPHFANI
jgi:hypothetical protein